MTSPTRKQAIAAILLPLLFITGTAAQDRSPWERPQTMDLPPAEPDPSRAPAYRPDSYPPAGPTGRSTRSRPNDAYVPPLPARSAWGDGLPGAPDTYPPAQQGDGYRPGPSADSYRTPPPGPGYGAPPAGYGAPYQPAPPYGG